MEILKFHVNNLKLLRTCNEHVLKRVGKNVKKIRLPCNDWRFSIKCMLAYVRTRNGTSARDSAYMRGLNLLIKSS